MRHRGFWSVVLASVVAITGWVLGQSELVDASEEESKSFREAYTQSEESAPEPDPGGMRLNYFDTPWKRVLADVARHSQLTLVIDRVPPGRFARRDRTRYSAKDCVRILNRDLEPMGYRLVTQGKHLILLNLDEVRTRYARPVLLQSSSGQTSMEPPVRPVSARTGQANSRVMNERTDHDSAAARRGKSSATIPIHNSSFKQSEQENADRTAQPDAIVTRMHRIENGEAADVARAVYLVFERRAELVQKGLQNLPTFVVYDTNDTERSEPPLFRVGIDQKENRLIVEAGQNRAEHLIRLLQRLDKPPAEPQVVSRLVESEGITDETARNLDNQVKRLVALRRQQQESGSVRPRDSAGPTDITDTSAFNLRGDVNIQAMEDLGVLMIEGNEEDLARLEPIIARLEQMSVGSLPDIHLLELQHVNSEAFSELLRQVYERLAALRQRGDEDRSTVDFFAVVQPNAVLILAPQLELPAILDLAEKLDTELDPSSEFRVFELRNAIASQVVSALNSFYEERPGLGTRIRSVSDVRTNSVIVQGHPRDLAEVRRLIDDLDRSEPGAVHKVKVIELNHATAEELAEVLNSAIQAVTSPPQLTTGNGGGFGGSQGPQELRDTKSIALEFLSTDGNAQQLIRSGFLVDVRINADPRSNSLIVSAPEASMALLQALIRTLDQTPSAIAAIKVFALQYADATQAVELLTTLFENTNQEEQLGVQIAGAEDASSSLIPLQFSGDIRTNTVLAVGSEEALSIVEAILLRLDTDDTMQRTTDVIPLRNAFAENVAESINLFLEQQQALQDSSEDLISNIERLRNEAIVAADVDSNSLIVSASPEYYSRITQIITDLDAVKPEVVIQALLVEVVLDNTDEFGVELGFQDPVLFTRSIVETAGDLITVPTTTNIPGVGLVESTTIVTQSTTPGFNFNNTGVGLGNNAIGDTGLVAGQGISNFSLGRQNGDLGFGGFVFSAQSDAVNLLIRALASRRTLHVLSRPQIRATHNNRANIRVGQEVPRVNGVTVQTTGAVSPQIEISNTGIILEVTPRINPDDTIVMDVYAEKSKLSDVGVPVYTDLATGTSIESPIKDISIAETTVSVPNGQTVVIGGMITKTDQTLERKVPWLGDLPVLGRAFRYDSTTTNRTELLVFLTPRIVYGDADSELIKQVESERLHFIESEAEEVHGPLYSVPARSRGARQMIPDGDVFDESAPVVDPAFRTSRNSTEERRREQPVIATPRERIRTPVRTVSTSRQEFDLPVRPAYSRDNRSVPRDAAMAKRSSSADEMRRQEPYGEFEQDVPEPRFDDVEWE